MDLQAANGLIARIEGDGSIRLLTVDERDGSLRDWLGRGTSTTASASIAQCDDLTVRTGVDDLGSYRHVEVADGDVRLGVTAYDDEALVVLTIEALRALSGIAGGDFATPSVGWPVFTPAERAEAAPQGLRAVVYTGCEFALPSNSGSALDRWFTLPHRPATGWPLLMRSDGQCMLVAPLDAFHEQIIGLNGGTLRCGWHGDLDVVPEGFTSHLAIWLGTSPGDLLDRWGSLLQRRAGTVRPGRWPDALGSRPSYWTDNGAAYWYRTEPGHDPAGSIVAAVDELRSQGVPLGAVQLDSWWYPHAVLRPFDTDEWIVPPTAVLAWEERPDVLPEGIPALRDRLGGPPLVAHIRHLSSEAAIAEEVPVHVDGDYAAPSTSEAYERWLDQCVSWGVETFEHDWLVEVFHGVRGIRSTAGEARRWQEGIDAAARERGITLQWCMATPADFAQTVSLTQVTSIRSSGDHGYIATPGQLWTWFCVTNMLARSLGLAPFKDVFRTDPDVAGTTGEMEALLSALSTGPVGLGDRVGRCDTSLVMRTCRADGTLVKPHVPIAASDDVVFSNPGFRRTALHANCWSDHPAGRWSYLVAAHANPDTAPLEVAVELPSTATDRVVWDWRRRTLTHAPAGDVVAVRSMLDHEDWQMLVVAPVLPSGVTVVGDPSLYAMAGDARLVVRAHPQGADVVVLGAGETVSLVGWSTHEVSATATGGAQVRTAREATGRLDLTVTVPERGWTRVQIRVTEQGTEVSQ